MTSRSRTASSRRPRRRTHAHHPRSYLRHDPGRSRRRGDQGRAGRRRPHAQAARLRRGLLRLLQSQQEEPGARRRIRPRAARCWCKLLQKADVLIENFAPGSMAKRGLGPEHLAEDQSAPRLLRAQGLPAGTLREAPRARRGRADDGRARLYDRSVGPAAARRHVGGRHHGRHVRRLRHGAGAEAARQDRARAGSSRARCSNRSCS